MSAALITAGFGLAKKFLGMERAEDQDDAELELAVVQATGQAARLVCVAYLFGPDLAPALPWVTAAEVAAYLEAIADATPAWKSAAKEGIVFAMWGLSERSIHRSKTARAERARRRGEAADLAHRPDGGPRK